MANIAVSKVYRKALVLYEIDTGKRDGDLIANTTLSTRSKNALSNYGFSSVKKAKEFFAKEENQKVSKSWHNFGKKCLDEVLEYLGLIDDAAIHRLKKRREVLEAQILEVDAKIKDLERNNKGASA